MPKGASRLRRGFIVVFGDNDPSIRVNDLRGELIEGCWRLAKLIPKYTLGGCAEPTRDVE